MSKNRNAVSEAQKHIVDILEEFSEANKQFFNYEVGPSTDEDYRWFDGEELEALSNLRTNGLSWVKVKSNGGGEGDGEECWTVYKFKHGQFEEEVFIKFDGWYQSYNGSEYQEFFAVKPVDRVVTFYE